MKHYFIHTRMAIIKMQTITGIGGDVENLEPPYISGGIVIWCSCCGNSLEISHHVKHSYHMTQQFYS